MNTVSWAVSSDEATLMCSDFKKVGILYDRSLIKLNFHEMLSIVNNGGSLPLYPRELITVIFGTEDVATFYMLKYANGEIIKCKAGIKPSFI